MKYIPFASRAVRVLACVAIALTASTPAAPAQQNHSGKMVIPARGLYSLNEGTVECWVQLNFDPAQPVEGYTARGELFRLVVPKADNDLGAEMGVFFASTSGKSGNTVRSFTFLRAGFAIDGKEVPNPLVVECSGWKRDEWHHIAVTWKDARHMAIYFDGTLAGVNEKAEVIFPYSIQRDIPETASLLIGSMYDQSVNDLTIDELRLSSVACEPSTLGFGDKPLQPDPFTMVLENFENVQPANGGAKYTTTPAVIAAVSAPKTYDITGGRLVPGKFGQAWKINDPT